MSAPELTPCPGCGDELPPRALRAHVCDWWRWLDHQVDLRRGELERFERDLGDYHGFPQGKFDLWYAARERERAA